MAARREWGEHQVVTVRRGRVDIEITLRAHRQVEATRRCLSISTQILDLHTIDLGHQNRGFVGDLPRRAHRLLAGQAAVTRGRDNVVDERKEQVVSAGYAALATHEARLI